MTGRTSGRAGKRAKRMLTIIGVVLAAGPLARPSAAQVGHDPGDSPYRDMVIGSGPVVFAGYLGGDRGRADAGPSNALSIGARFELPTGRSLTLQLSAAYLQGDRFIINPAVNADDPERRTGPADANLFHVEAAMQLRLTGVKTWHRLAPHVGIGLGMVFDAGSPGDTTNSGYGFRSRVTLSGGTGVRLQTTRRVMLHADLRMMLWRLRYPVSFHSAAPDGSRVVPLEEELTDWTVHPWVSLGVGWTF